MRRLCATGLGVVLLVAGAPARAGEGEPSPAPAPAPAAVTPAPWEPIPGDERKPSWCVDAEAVLAAYRAGDGKLMRALASKDDPDEFLVAEELCARGEHDAALAFANARVHPDVALLPAYVESRRGKSCDPALRRARREAAILLRDKDAAAALAILDRLRGRDSPVVASCTETDRAAALQALGRTEEQLAARVAAARYDEESGWYVRLAWNLRAVAALASDLRDTATAIAAREREIAVHEKRSSRRGVAGALTRLGWSHESLRQWDRALRAFERAREAYRELQDAAGEGGLWRACGRVHVEMGDAAAGLACHERSLAILERAGKPADCAESLLGAAGALRALGRDADALDRLGRAVALYRSAGHAEGVCLTLQSVADVRIAAGDFDAARAALDEASAAATPATQARVLGGVSLRRASVHAHDGDVAAASEDLLDAMGHMLRAGSRTGVADVLRDARRLLASPKDRAAAGRFFEKARLLAATYGDARAEACALGGLAVTALAAGDTAAALDPARRALACLPLVPEPLGEEVWTGVRWEFADALGAGAAACARSGDAEGLHEFLEAGRASALLAALRLPAGPVALPADLRIRSAAARAAEAAAVDALRAAVATGEMRAVREAQEQVDDARARVRDVVEEERRLASEPRARTSDPRDPLAAVRARLRPGDVYVAFGLLSPPEIDEAVAVVATRDVARTVRLGRARDVEAAAGAVASAAGGAGTAAAAEKLRRAAVSPLALGADTTRVLVSPDGALALVPPALLFPGRDVAMLPSGTVQGVLAGRGAARGEDVLAVGDPVYDEAADSVVASLRGASVQLSRLPATAAEAKAVGDVVLLRGAATEGAVREALARGTRWRAVHLACHGVPDEARPLFSALALTPSAGDDGFVTALEAFRLRVDADLVTLSACETGTGRVCPGEGSVGLARAFLAAGAPRVLVSLWRVDDTAACALMTEFYARFRKGVPASRALREAQEAIRSRPGGDDPRAWAAWALWGDAD